MNFQLFSTSSCRFSFMPVSPPCQTHRLTFVANEAPFWVELCELFLCRKLCTLFGEHASTSSSVFLITCNCLALSIWTCVHFGRNADFQVGNGMRGMSDVAMWVEDTQVVLTGECSWITQLGSQIRSLQLFWTSCKLSSVKEFGCFHFLAAVFISVPSGIRTKRRSRSPISESISRGNETLGQNLDQVWFWFHEHNRAIVNKKLRPDRQHLSHETLCLWFTSQNVCSGSHVHVKFWGRKWRVISFVAVRN